MVMDMSRAAAVRQIKGDLDLVEGDDGDNVSMTSSTDGTIVIFSMIDGAPREILKTDFERVMNKRLEDGRPSFWHDQMPGDPPPEYRLGELKCFLHPEYAEDGRHFDRAFVDAIGLRGRTCNMNNTNAANRADFPTWLDREDHERSKHSKEKGALELALARRQEDADRAERAQTNAAMLAMAGNVAAPAAPVAAPVAPTAVLGSCGVEGCDYAGTAQGLLVHTAKMHKGD